MFKLFLRGYVSCPHVRAYSNSMEDVFIVYQLLLRVSKVLNVLSPVYIYIYIYIYILYVCACVCVPSQGVNVLMRARVCARACVCVRTVCMYVCMYVCMWVWVCACVPACVSFYFSIGVGFCQMDGRLCRSCMIFQHAFFSLIDFCWNIMTARTDT